MKRFAPLALIVLALTAAVPVALADDAPSAPPAASSHHGVRLQILQLRLRIVELRYSVACRDESSDRCTQFKTKVTERITKVDDKVQAKLAKLKCTPDSAEKKCVSLSKLDEKLQDVLAKLSA